MTEALPNHEEYRIQHSTFFEATFGMPSLAKAFLRKFLPRRLVKRLDIEKLVIVKEKFRDGEFRETRPDMVYEVPIIGMNKRVRIHIILEHKSTDDHSAIFQIWKYVGQACVQNVEKQLTNPKTKKHKAWPKNFRLSPVIPIIIHHGLAPFTGETQLAKLFYPLPGVKKYLPRQEAYLFDLSAMKEENLPRDAGAPELYVVLLIMKVIFSKNAATLRRKFREILKELRPYSQNSMYYELIRSFWLYTVYNTERLSEADYEEMDEEIQETITGDHHMPNFVQTLMDRGMEKGMEKGMELGISQGEAKAILRTLTRRFHSIPKSLREGIFAITNLKRLEELADFAFDCESLDEFAAAIK